MGRLPRFLQILGVNSVPVVGVFAAGWTGATALALYWCENVMVTLLVGLRIWLHRRATGKRGHWADVPLVRGGSAKKGSFLAGFLSGALIFTAAHAVFLAVILFLILPSEYPEAGGVDLEALWRGVAFVAVILGVGFLIDAGRIERRSFAWVHRMAGRVLGRVVLVHLTIIFGVAAMGWLGGPRGLFLVFAGLKTLADLGTFLGRDDLPDRDPPPWLQGFIRRVAGAQNAEDFAEFYRKQHDRERRDEAEWEMR